MKYFLKTTYPCLVKVKNENFELDTFDTLEIENEDYLFVYPQKNLYPFYINLKNPVENTHFSFSKHDNKTFLILENEKTFGSQTKEKFVIDGKTCFVGIDENKVSFETESRKTSAKILSRKNFQLSMTNNFVLAKFDNEIFAFDTKTEKLSHFSGENLSIENDTIKVEQNSLDGQKISTYKLGETIETLSVDFTEKNTAPVELLPLNFLKYVKSKDYDRAINTLSQNLKDQISQENLGDFFGNFNAILPLNTLEFITISNDKKNFVKFSIKDDKVEDILIDEL